MRKLVCFYLNEQEYAADIDDIKETMALRPITRVFLTPAWMLGIINLRGDVVAVIDLAQLLGLPATVPTDDSRIIIARHEGKNVGVIVDQVAELRTMDIDGLQTPPATLSDEGAALLAGIATVDDGAPLRVLDLPGLFDSERLQAFQREGRA